MLFGIASFSGMDAVGKWVVRDHSVFQLLFLRSAVAILILAVLAPVFGGRNAVRTTQPFAHVLRSICSVLAFLFFFVSVRYLPLADAVAVAFGGPFIVTALSVPLLGETVDRRRWMAVGVGFLGMLLIVQPTSGAFRPAALLVVAASFAYAFMMVLTRWMSRRSETGERTFVFLAFTFAIQTLVGLSGSLSNWAPMAPLDIGLSCVVGILALGGHYGITAAFQRAPASVVAPFEYTALLWATLFGFLIFGDFPDVYVWLGVAIIVAAGLYTIRREDQSLEDEAPPSNL